MLELVLFLIFIIPFMILCSYVGRIKLYVKEIRDILKNKSQ